MILTICGFVLGLAATYGAGAMYKRAPRVSAGVALVGAASLAMLVFWPAEPPETVDDPELVRRAGAAEARAAEAETLLAIAMTELEKTRVTASESRARVRRALEGADPASDLILIDTERDASRLLWTSP